MNQECKRRNNCRLCSSKELKLCFKFNPTPPANAFVNEEKIMEEQPVFPLDVYFCENCYHIQILDIVDPKILFENYVYVSGTSSVFVKHFEEYANHILRKFPQPKDSQILDIGSNDGTLLDFFKEKGFTVLGIDPAKEICDKANSDGINTINEFFNFEFSKVVKEKYGKMNIITANNVFAHVDDLKDFVKGVKNLLSDDGIFVFEVSYIMDVVQKLLFDTIYHEHLSYHSIISLIPFFRENEMELIETIRTESHGGSLKGIVKLKKGKYKIGKSVKEYLQHEKEQKLDKLETYNEFFKRIEVRRDELQKLLKKLKDDKKIIAGFGAPAKATTFMYQFGIDEKMIDFIIDDNPLKQGLYSPGRHIPVYSSEKIYEKNPDYLIILAWNFSQSIMKKHQKFNDNGGHFIIPLPKLEVI